MVAGLFAYLGLVSIITGILPKYVDGLFALLAVFVVLPVGCWRFKEVKQYAYDYVEKQQAEQVTEERTAYRRYTLMDGRVLEARFLSYREGTVTLLQSSGEVFEAPIMVFEKRDQDEFVRRSGQ